MKALTPEQVRQAVHGRWLARPQETTLTGVSTDTRSARAGDLFIPLIGESFDGHDFLSAAAKAGCPTALVQDGRLLPPGLAESFPGGLITVDNTGAALCDLAAWHRRQLRTAVIAVTGSNGKTTVKRMIDRILSTKLAGSASPKSFNNEVGVPLTLLAVRPEDDYVVCEVGSNAPGEVEHLGNLCRPNVAAVIHVGPSHLAGLGTLEDVAAEKASLLAGLADGGLAVVWGDSPLLERACKPYARRTVRFGDSPDCELRLTDYHPAGRGSRIEVNGRFAVQLTVPGRHNAMNALAALAVAQRFGFTIEQSAAALADFRSEAMRLEWIDAVEGAVINDAYNANPASMLAAAEVLAGQDAARRVLIAGDMRELGDEGPQLHRDTGRRIAQRPIGLIIGVGELGSLLAAGAREGGTKTRSFDSAESAIAAVPKLIKAGDCVLVKGSRSTRMERLIPAILKALGGAREPGDGDPPQHAHAEDGKGVAPGEGDEKPEARP